MDRRTNRMPLRRLGIPVSPWFRVLWPELSLLQHTLDGFDLCLPRNMSVRDHRHKASISLAFLWRSSTKCLWIRMVSRDDFGNWWTWSMTWSWWYVGEKDGWVDQLCMAIWWLVFEFNNEDAYSCKLERGCGKYSWIPWQASTVQWSLHVWCLHFVVWSGLERFAAIWYDNVWYWRVF